MFGAGCWFGRTAVFWLFWTAGNCSDWAVGCFIDFGEFTLTGLAFSPVDGQAALFDHIYLARQPEDFADFAVWAVRRYAPALKPHEVSIGAE